MPLKILFVSTSVGPLGSGLGGGVELTLANLAKALEQRGHEIVAIAPEQSLSSELTIMTVPGELQATAQTQGRAAQIELTGNSVLGNMWEKARQIQADYDVILNFAYDWLPLYLTPFFQTPLAHLISMGSLTDAMDHIIGETARRFPGSIGVHSLAQAETFSFAGQCHILYNGFDLSQYQFQAQAERPHALGWVGRIAPEKGLEDAAAVADQLQIPLKVWGAMQHQDYWQAIQAKYPQAPLEYCGFLETHELQQQLGRCQGLIMTPKWVEAFGNVAIEALACGVPVVAYARGGPAEIVADGINGWLVEPDSVSGLVAAIQRLAQIDRARCRQEAESRYSLAAMGDRVEAWLQALL